MPTKIALMWSAPSSIALAPFDDPNWEIWGCSPGLYGSLIQRNRVPEAWFELHRWEPPVLGKADQQVPWFSPEYVAWMGQLPVTVWMERKIDAIPASQALPWQQLCEKYGHFFFT